MSRHERTQTRRRVIGLGAASLLFLWSTRMRSAERLREDEFKGAKAPDWRLEALDGKTYRLSDLKGAAVVLNFWATWCAPCRVEANWLAEIYDEFRPRGLAVLGVSMDELADDAAVAEFARKYEVEYPILLRGASIADKYGGVRYLPQTFFIDRSGTIVRNTLGIKDHAELRQEVSKLVQ
jgi:peroxiredoxin